MPIEIVDMVKTAHELKKRKVLLNTKRFHAWVHYYPNVGDKDDMHCHNHKDGYKEVRVPGRQGSSER